MSTANEQHLKGERLIKMALYRHIAKLERENKEMLLAVDEALRQKQEVFDSKTPPGTWTISSPTYTQAKAISVSWHVFAVGFCTGVTVAGLVWGVS